MTPATPQSVPLADFVAGLRRELREIQASREPEPAVQRFR
jgi:hypothetical protein